MEHKWMPTVAGILDIVAASFKLLVLFGLCIALVVLHSNSYIDPTQFGRGMPVKVITVLWVIAIPAAVLGILGLVGGIYALQRKNWGLALAGSIAAFLPSSILGVVAIIFTALSKKQFE